MCNALTDAIFINQSDEAEKAIQVSQMGTVYSSARSLRQGLAWDWRRADLQIVYTFVDSLGSRLCKRCGGLLRILFGNWDDFSSLAERVRIHLLSNIPQRYNGIVTGPAESTGYWAMDLPNQIRESRGSCYSLNYLLWEASN